MKSARQLLREHVAAILKEVGTLAGDRIYTGRASDVWRGELPACLVYVSAENPERINDSPPVYDTTFTITVESLVEQRVDSDTHVELSTAENDLDTLGEQVSVAIMFDTSFGELAKDVFARGAVLSFVDGGEQVLAAEIRKFDVVIQQQPTEADPKALAPFLKLRHRVDLPGGIDTTLTSPTADSDVETDIPQT